MIMVNIEISSSVNNFSFWGKNENENENKYLVWPKMVVMVFQDLETDFVGNHPPPPHRV